MAPDPHDDQSDIDEDLEIWDQFACAVRWLRRQRLRPELTHQLAVQEALGSWLAEHAALHHQSEPFPVEESGMVVLSGAGQPRN